MDFWQRYRAIDARDTRFDGQFYTAVRTTGIYCRPSCPARTPKADNVTFYETSAAAHDAGYRACKRCLPEAVPGTPAWNVRSDIAGRAMRLINDGVINRDGVEGLAARLGYSSRQLNRILSHELGAGPLSLARASRAQTARTLLVSTAMKVSDIAFAAGFSSVRQFNETIGEVFAMTPSALRATARHHRSPAATTALTLNLPYREPFDPGVFDFLAVRAIPGIEEGTSSSYARTLRLTHGDARFRVDYDAGAPGRPLVLTIGAVDLRDLAALLSRVRRLLDLDADPVAIDAALAADPRLAATVARTPGMRMPGAVDPQELLDPGHDRPADHRGCRADRPGPALRGREREPGARRRPPPAVPDGGPDCRDRVRTAPRPAAADRFGPGRRGCDGLGRSRLRLRR